MRVAIKHNYLERYPNGYTCHFVRPQWKFIRNIPTSGKVATLDEAKAQFQAAWRQWLARAD